MEYKIGQILHTIYGAETKEVNGKRLMVPKCGRVIIGADGLAHHIDADMIQPLREDAVVKGYDAEGLAECIYEYLEARFPIDEMIEDYEIGKNDIQNEIEYCLEDIGFC